MQQQTLTPEIMSTPKNQFLEVCSMGQRRVPGWNNDAVSFDFTVSYFAFVFLQSPTVLFSNSFCAQLKLIVSQVQIVLIFQSILLRVKAINSFNTLDVIIILVGLIQF